MDLNQVFSLGKLPGLTCSCLLILTHLQTGQYLTNFLSFYVSSHSWQNIPIPGHLDGLLLASMSVFMQCFYRCLSKSWRQKMDGTGTYFWKVSSTHQHQWPFSLARKNLELTLTSLRRSASDGPPSELLEVLSWFSVSGCWLSRQRKPCLSPHGQVTR